MTANTKVDIELTPHEFAHMQASLITHAQTLQTYDAALAAPAWSALSKLMGVPDARKVVPTRLPTREDAAALLVECEFELAKQRARGGAQ